MVRKSTELAAVMRRLLAAFEDRDSETVRGLISQSDDTLVIGSDAREWLYGVEAYEVTARQVAETPPYRFTAHRLDAYEEGTVGWVAADTTVEFNGQTSSFRVTAVFALEAGVWRVVQWHASVPAPIHGLSGWEPPTSLADVMGTDSHALEQLLRAQYRTATVTFLFSDIEESTSLASRTGDFVWADVVQRHFAEVRRIAEAHSGSVVKTLGDGVMLAFDSARDAVRAAADIQQSVSDDRGERIQVRIGVHCGDAVRLDDDYSGQTVTTTARLSDAASRGEVLVSGVVRDLVAQSPEFTFGDAFELELKGIPELVRAHALELGEPS